IGMTSNSSINGAITASRLVVESDFYHPFNPGNPLGYDPATTKFALYDAADPLREILLTSTGTLSKVVTAGVATGLNWFLNFDSSQGPVDTHWIQGQTTYAGVPTDGDDIIFGDLGNDWLAGGTGRDQLYGGWGDDLMNADDYLTTAGGLNNTTDTNPSYEDLVYGGAGRDVLIANTEGDRLVDWTGEFNSYLVPFSKFGGAGVIRSPSPANQTFLFTLAMSRGADPYLAARYGSDPARSGEPFGELGEVIQGDAAWNNQHGGPRDPQPGNTQGAFDVNLSAGTLPIWQFEAGPAPAATGSATAIATGELAPIVAEAEQLWISALGADDARIAVLNGITIDVGDLPDGALGVTEGNHIHIDSDASGWGWFIDPTPGDNSEFRTALSGGVFTADPS